MPFRAELTSPSNRVSRLVQKIHKANGDEPKFLDAKLKLKKYKLGSKAKVG
jgi:hypothetical protein